MEGLVEFVYSYGWIMMSIPLLVLVIGLASGEVRKSFGPWKFNDYEGGTISKRVEEKIFTQKSRQYLLKSLWQKLTEFEERVERTNKESLKRSTALHEQIIELRELNYRMTKEAAKLAKAPKGNVKMQGNWGAVILEQILEKSGLEKGREYFIQETLHSEAGRQLRPDVVIKLPDNKNLVIDAKMPLFSYEKYMNEEDITKKEQHLKEHILSIKSHVEVLSNKNYHQLFDGGKLDYVVMFVPIESAFALLVQHGEDLYSKAHKKNIVIVSPATLTATLQTVSSIWKHEYQNQEALEIAKEGEELYSGFKDLIDELELARN